MYNLENSPFRMNIEEKDRILTEKLIELTAFHRDHCPAYEQMLRAIDFSEADIKHYSQIPFLPVGLFKSLTLSSMEDGEFKTVTSSGTSGSAVSKILLDGETRSGQQQALANIGSDFLGENRLPMLVIDCPATVENREDFSARTAGILGFSLFGKRRVFALNDDMTVNKDAVNEFLNKYGNQPFLIFGFTYIIWKHLVCSGIKYDLTNGILIHGGGWKKLISQAVSKEDFKKQLREQFAIKSVHDYYGMAEQTGSIFMECECGHLHASDYSGIIFRRAKDFSVCDVGEKGIAQVLSVLPKSYPGHSLLTEDEGMLLGVDDCPCGRKGAYFEIIGRLKNAQIRGCSDTYEG